MIKRPIDAQEALRLIWRCNCDPLAYREYADHIIRVTPTIDAVPVVRCKDCSESEECPVAGNDCLYCGVWDTIVRCNGYCDHGAKMDGGENDA